MRHPTSRTQRLRSRATGLAATLVILAIVVGLPVTLIALGSAPIPDSVPTLEQIRAAVTSWLSGPDDGTLALAAVKVIAWAAWLFLTGAIAADIVARVRGVRVPRLPGLHLPQAAAHGLVGAAILLFAVPLSPLAATTSGVDAGHHTAVHTSVHPTEQAATHFSVTAEPPIGAAGTNASVLPAQARRAGSPSSRRIEHRVEHTVVPGETLWSIAQHHLGSGARYPEIVQLNETVLGSDPGFLRVGEVLRLPAPQRPTDQSSTVDDGRTTDHLITVHRGDTLSEIALEELGRADLYPDIFEASRHTRQPDGRQLRDPDLIQPGWILTIPTSPTSPTTGAATAAAPATTSRPPDVVPERTAASPGRPDPAPTPAPAPAPAPARRAPAEPKGSASHPQESATPSSTGTRPPSESSATQAPSGPSSNVEGRDGSQDHVGESSSWMLAGLTGGGALLAGAMLLLLRRRRRAQFRSRRPGRTIATPEPRLSPVEKTVAAAGSGACADVEAMDETLRRLAARAAHHQRPMPELAAVELAPHALTLHLSAPTTLDPPWRGSDDQLHWTLPGSTQQGELADVTDLSEVGPLVVDQPAPYPLLVTIGTGDDGNVWLLNLEDLALSVTGDPTFGQDFARYVVAEVACNPWSQRVHVDLVGVAHEVAPMNTDRIHIRVAPRTGAGTGGVAGTDLAAEILADAMTLIERSTDAAVDLSTARAFQSGADPWPARLLLVDLSAEAATIDRRTDTTGDADDRDTTHTAGMRPSTDGPDMLSQLLDVLDRHAGQTGTSVVLLGENHPGTTLTLQVTADGRISLPHAGLDLIAVGLTSDEAQGCAALLAQSEDLEDVPMPVNEQAGDGWRAWSDEAGALRAQHTRARHSDSDASAEAAGAQPAASTDEDLSINTGGALDESAVSVLDRDDEDYLAVGATTARDLATLAPKVPRRVREAVGTADPSLDEDLAMWWSADCPLPRLALLGPVWARARGVPPTKQKPYLTEVLAFLATRPHGVTPDEVANQFDVSPTKARDYVNRVREWLGVNPRTGIPHLPDARKAPATRERGVSVYQVLDLLVDVDLFRRLRVRGTARGPDGLEDLNHALRLVRGRPFDQLRPAGWSWLFEGDRLDHHMVCAVVDVAHLVTTASLAVGNTQQARHAAEIASTAAPDEETPRLDLAAVLEAEGHHSEAARIIREEACNRTDDDDVPPELSDRTREIIAARDWQKRTWRAS